MWEEVLTHIAGWVDVGRVNYTQPWVGGVGGATYTQPWVGRGRSSFTYTDP